MYRPLALVSLWFALLAPSAGAATVGVYDDPEATAVALAGPDAVVLRQVRREGSGNLVMDARIPNGRIGLGGEGSAELGVQLPGRDE